MCTAPAQSMPCRAMQCWQQQQKQQHSLASPYTAHCNAAMSQRWQSGQVTNHTLPESEPQNGAGNCHATQCALQHILEEVEHHMHVFTDGLDFATPQHQPASSFSSPATERGLPLRYPGYPPAHPRSAVVSQHCDSVPVDMQTGKDVQQRERTHKLDMVELPHMVDALQCHWAHAQSEVCCAPIMWTV